MKTLIITFLILLSNFVFAQNYAIDFNGTNQSFTSTSTMNLSGSAITIEAWINSKSFQSTSPYISSIAGMESSPNTALLRVGDGGIPAGNQVQFVLQFGGSQTKITGSTVLLINTWYHIVGVYNGTTMKLYVNGVEDASTNVTGAFTANSNFQIGHVASTRYFNGQIDEVRVWSVARTLVQIRANMFKEIPVNSANLTAYYKMSDGSGTSLSDNGTNGTIYNGTLSNTPAWVTSGAFAGPRNALDFNTTTSYSTAGQSAMSNIDNWTIMAWFNPSSLAGTGFQAIVYNGDDSGGYGFGLVGNQVTALYGAVTWHNSIATIPSTGRWYHVAMRRSGGTLQFFLDGELLSYTSTAVPNSPFGNFTIGNMFKGDHSTLYSNSFNGQIDEVSVWNTALTAAQIRDYMGKTLAGNETNLAAYYRFDQKSAASGASSTLYDVTGNGIDLTLTNMNTTTDWVSSSAFNTWIGSISTSSATAENWSSGSTPSSTDNIGIYSYTGGNDVAISGTPTVKNLIVSSTTTLTVSSGFTVTGNLILNSNLDPNGNTVSLSSAGTLIEGSGVFYGTSGTITTTRTLDGSTTQINENVAGLGATITTSANMGSTTITRGHTVQTKNSNNSIKRYYDITPTTNTGLNATLVFNYATSELNGLTEANLKLFKSTDSGASWTLAGGTVSTASNTVTLSSIGSFSRWTLADNTSPLPVELTSFTAKVVAGIVTLNWKTATEVNNYGFEIERRSNLRGQGTHNGNSDLEGYKSIGFVNGHGNSNSVKLYSFTDNSVVSGKYKYRLKQIDTEGQFEYSDIVNVTMGAPSKFELSRNYPNPFNPSTQIKYSIPSNLKEGTVNVKLSVFNVLGQKVASLINKEQSAGNYVVTFDSDNIHSTGSQRMAAGVYIYNLQISNSTGNIYFATKKMILLK